VTSIVDADSACPHDPRFEHRVYFGCVPADFSDGTGRSKRRRQTETEVGLPWKVWLWDGGCDASGDTARRKLVEHQRRVTR
jgi:hypothetical protein